MKQDSTDSKENPPLQPSRTEWLFAVAWRTLLSAALIAASAAVVIVLVSRIRPLEKKTVEATLPVVEVEPIGAHDGGIDFEVDGVVIPFREIEVASQVAGEVVFKSNNCRMGRTVKQGEVLLRIDKTDYSLDLMRIEQELAKAKADRNELSVDIAARPRQIEMAEEDHRIKKAEVARYEKIDDPGVYSQSELDAARLKELQARDAVQTENDHLELLNARVQRMDAAVLLMTAQRDKAQRDLERTEITAPIDGVVTQEIAEYGGYVQRGGPIVRIQDTSCMEIRCSLQMHEMRWLLRSMTKATTPAEPRNTYRIPETPATVSFDTGETTYHWQGNVSYFDGGRVDKQTRMIPCRVYVREPLEFEVESGSGQSGENAAALALMTGMFVKVTVHARPDLELVRIPETAIQPGNTVWTVAADGTKGTLHQVAIRVAHSSGETALAYADDGRLKPDDLVVVSPLAAPIEGGSVEIMEAK